MRARVAIALSGLVIGAIVVTTVPGAALTNANWTDSEWDYGSIAASSFDCGTDDNYTTTASGRFLSGGVLGVNLDALAELAPVTAHRSGPGPAAFSPARATHLPGGANRDSYLNPLNIAALTGIGIDLSGLTLGLPIGSAGALNQYAQVTNTGYAAGASGLVTNDGGLGVTPSTPSGELPKPATIGLSTLLPVTAGIAGVGLEIGAVAASSILDWCAQLENLSWGDRMLDASTRDYGIAGLDLLVRSPLLTTLVPQVQTTIGALNTALAGLQGTSGLISNAVLGTLTGAGGVLQKLNLGSITGTVTLSTLNLTAVTALLAGPGAVLSDGVVSVDLADPSGAIRVDLAALLGGPDQLNKLPANTELVINDAVINDIIDRVGALVQGWVNRVTGALIEAVSAVQLALDLTVRAGVTVLGGPVDILTVQIKLNAGLGQLLYAQGATPQVAVSASVLSGVTGLVLAAVNLLLGTLLGLNLNGLVDGINANVALRGQLLTAVTSTVVSALKPILDGLVTSLTTTVTQLVTALGAVLRPLPTVLSAMVNVQPDRSGAPPGYGYASGSPPHTSQQYLVTALRIGLLDGAAPVYLNLATASAGSNSLLP